MTVMIYHDVLVMMQRVWALFVAVLHRDAWTRMAPPFSFSAVQLWLMQSHQQAALRHLSQLHPHLGLLRLYSSLTEAGVTKKQGPAKGPEQVGGWNEGQEKKSALNDLSSTAVEFAYGCAWGMGPVGRRFQILQSFKETIAHRSSYPLIILLEKQGRRTVATFTCTQYSGY